MAQDNGLLIDIDPEIKRVLEQSKYVSSKWPFFVVFRLSFNIVYCAATNGSGVHLLKVGSKRRRTKQEIKDEQLEAEMRDDAIQAATRRADNLERQLMAA